MQRAGFGARGRTACRRLGISRARGSGAVGGHRCILAHERRERSNPLLLRLSAPTRLQNLSVRANIIEMIPAAEHALPSHVCSWTIRINCQSVDVHGVCLAVLHGAGGVGVRSGAPFTLELVAVFVDALWVGTGEVGVPAFAVDAGAGETVGGGLVV